MNYALSAEAQATLATLKAKPILNRAEKQTYLFQYLQPKNHLGLEIGPNLRALVSKNDGFKIDYIEAMSTAQFKELLSKKSPPPT